MPRNCLSAVARDAWARDASSGLKPALGALLLGATLLAAPVFGPPAVVSPAFAQSTDKPYDDRLLRLSEILGAMHYLRELCGANEGQVWRDRMRELLDAEGATNALRRARFTRSFNLGYQSYSKTHRVCTPTAQTAINRFMSEGVQIAENLVRSVP